MLSVSVPIALVVVLVTPLSLGVAAFIAKPVSYTHLLAILMTALLKL